LSLAVNNALLTEAAAAADTLLGHPRPLAALILGSGWNEVAEAFPIRRAVPYADIPCLGSAGVAGHAGRLLSSDAGNCPLLVFQGRRHWYEGAGWEPIACPIRISLAMGARFVVLTNAAGGIRADLKAGDLMVIDDHVNAMGVNPLIGPHVPAWGQRFPDQSGIYDPALRGRLHSAAERLGMRLPHGVYLATAGPAYETPAEVTAFRAMGADAVGMSTVPEATLAHAAGMRVAGVSCIANPAAGVSPAPLSHEDVLAATSRAQPRMKRLLIEFFTSLNTEDERP
jgi:inosine/guanosine/xanthosine phosphorylase family protein